MGKTEILNNNGPGSISCNPANLAFQESVKLQISGRLHLGTVDADYYDNDYVYSYDNNYPLHSKITSASIAFPIKAKDGDFRFCGGFAYNTYFDEGQNQTIEIEYQDYETEITDIMQSGGLSTIAAAVGISYSEKVHFGIAIHKSVFSGMTDRSENESSPAGFDYSYDEISMDYDALYVSLGQIVEFSDRLIVGVMYRSEFNLKLTDVKYEFETIDGYHYESEFLNMDWKIPAYAGIAVNYRIKPSALLSLEYQTRPFSGIKPQYYGSSGSPFYGWSGLRNGGCYRAGLEISKPIVWRMGFFADNIFWADNDNLPNWLTGLTLGTGFDVYDFHYDLFGQFSSWGYKWGDDDYKEYLFDFGITASYTFK